MLTVEQLNKIENATKVKLHYPAPYETKYAVIEYYGRRGKPLKVASYYIYGEELKSGRPLVCWHWLPSMVFDVIADGFASQEEAELKLSELRRLKNETNT